MKIAKYLFMFVCCISLSACFSSKSDLSMQGTISPSMQIPNSIPTHIATPTPTPTPTLIVTLTPTPITTETPKQTDQWRTYTNGRYGFSIRYPSEWTTAEESDNSDGKKLYIGNPDVDIRAYASHYTEGISDPYHDGIRNLQRQQIKLANGDEAVLIVGKQNGKILYDTVSVSKNIEYHFYAEISERFFQANEQILLRAALSLDTHLPGMDK